jgi:hypothetical protein
MVFPSPNCFSTYHLIGTGNGRLQTRTSSTTTELTGDQGSIGRRSANSTTVEIYANCGNGLIEQSRMTQKTSSTLGSAVGASAGVTAAVL